MANYCTLADVKAQMPESGLASSTDYDLALTGMISAVSRLIDLEVGRYPDYFAAPDTATVRYFDGTGLRRVAIDEAIAITTVAVSEEGGLSSTDYTAWAATDYVTEPYNRLPIRSLLVDRLNGTKIWFDNYIKAVKVTAKFGYSATPPEDVRTAAIIQTIRSHMRSKNAYTGAGASPEFGQTVINIGGRGEQGTHLDSDVKAILNHYKVDNMAASYD